MDNLIWKLTGDPEIDNAISKAMRFVHPLEAQFPIGSFVKVITPVPQLIARIQDDDTTYLQAMNIARDMTDGPCEVVGIHDLTDDDGESRPYITIQSQYGYGWPFKPDDLERI